MLDETAAKSTPSKLGLWLGTEALGAGAFTFVIVAAGILGERFAGGNTALVMLIIGLAGASAYAVVAQLLSGIATAGFNPAIALAYVLAGRLALIPALLAAAAQIAGGLAGAMAAHLVTNMGLVQVATQIQTGAGVWTGEFIATVLFVLAVLRTRGQRNYPSAENSYAGAVCLLAVSLATPSLSFANPAVTLARTLTDTFSSIRLEDALVIACVQLLGGVAAYMIKSIPRSPVAKS